MGKVDRKKRRRDEEKGDHGYKNSERVGRSVTRRDRSEYIEDEIEKNRDYKVIKEKDHHDRARRVIKEKDREWGSRRDRVRGKTKGKDRDDKERSSYGERDKLSGRNHDEGRDRVKDGRKDEKGFQQEKNEQKIEGVSSSLELKEHILKMKEERLKKNKSDVLSWVHNSRKIEEKEKALHLSKVFEEQDNNIDQGDSEDDEGPTQHLLLKNLAGVKVLHGLEKVVEGGAVVLTLIDQNILADGGINEEVDMLENVEIGKQKRRDQAYKPAKKKTGIYEDKFSNDVGSEKKMLPQYDDDLVEDECVTLDDSGRYTGEAERKLEELHKRIQGVSTSSRFEDLHSSGKVSSDYYTQEEMLQFKKPKKKKSMSKKEKLDLDALEAEAISAGLGVGDLGSRKDAKMQSSKAEEEKSKVTMRNDAYQSAYAKASESAKALTQEQFLTAQVDRDENPIFGDDDDDLYKSLERAKKIALNKQYKVVASGPQVVSSLALAASSKSAGIQTVSTKETQEEKIVFTEMEEFVWGLQLNEKCYQPDGEGVFVDEDEVPNSSDQERKDEVQPKVKDTNEDEHVDNEMKEVVLDETIHEVRVGKGLSGALQLLKDRGMLKKTVDWVGRNMDKKKSKLVGIYENNGIKEIRIERKDEFGRTMTPKEAYRRLSHIFHGKGPGKMKQEKRLKQHQEELKLMQMKNSDTPSQLMERMREAQARLKLPCIVLSGHVKQGQTSDTISGFTTVENLPGGLTPTLGGRKHEHFLGINRKADLTSVSPPKKPKT